MLLLMGQKSVYSPQTCDLKIYSRLNQFLGSKVSKKTEERKLTTNKEVSWGQLQSSPTCILSWNLTCLSSSSTDIIF